MVKRNCFPAVLLLSLLALASCTPWGGLTTRPTPAAPTAATATPRLLYTSAPHNGSFQQLRLALPDGSERTLAACSSASCTIPHAVVAPAGSHVAYLLQPEAQSLAQADLRLVGLDGTGDRLLASDVAALGSFSPDGTRLLFTRMRNADPAPVAEGSIWLVNLTGGEPQLVLPWGFFQSVGPWIDDQTVLYAKARGGTPPCKWESFRLNVNQANAATPFRSGKALALDSSGTSALLWAEQPSDRCTGRADLLLAPLDGSAPTPIQSLAPAAASAASARLSPDGTWMALLRNHGELDQIAGAHISPITDELQLPRGTLLDDIFWLPDGQIVYVRNTAVSLFVTDSKTTLTLPIVGPLARLLEVLP